MSKISQATAIVLFIAVVISCVAAPLLGAVLMSGEDRAIFERAVASEGKFYSRTAAQRFENMMFKNILISLGIFAVLAPILYLLIRSGMVAMKGTHEKAND